MRKNKRLIEIDSLRGIAALSVLLFHFNLFDSNSILNFSLLIYGGTGVDLFFIISGFVIFMSISNTNNLREFWFSRFNRLFPSYWLSIIVALISFYLFANFNFHRPWNYLAGNLLMMQPLFKTTNLVDAYWTLYIELTFYAFISIIWLFKLNNKIEIIIWICLIISIVLNAGYRLKQNDEAYVKFFIITQSIMPLMCYFCFFAAGMVYYLIYTNGLSLNRLLLLLCCFSITALIHNISGRFNLFFDTTARMYCVGVYYLLFAMVVSKKASILNNKWLSFFGAISYPLYLIHESIGLSFYSFLTHYINKPIAILGGISISIILAVLITYKFEKPVHKWLKTKFYAKNIDVKPALAK